MAIEFTERERTLIISALTIIQKGLLFDSDLADEIRERMKSVYEELYGDDVGLPGHIEDIDSAFEVFSNDAVTPNELERIIFDLCRQEPVKEYVLSFSVDLPAGANFTPSSLIYEWAQANGYESWNTMDGIKVKTFAGVLKYHKYDVDSAGDTDHITVYMERDRLYNG